MDIARIAEQVGPAVAGLGSGARGGSGVFVDERVVVTLAHHLRAEEVELVAGGRRLAARVAGADRQLDVAVLRTEAAGPAAVAWAPDADLPIGTPVAALGDPAGRGLRATAGALASAPRRVRAPGGRLIEGVLEHTAPVPSGAGGGPLVDAEGRLLGLNGIRERGGLLLAWPTAVLRPRVEAILAGRHAEPPRLGVQVAPPAVARRLRGAVGLPERDGVLVRGVVEGSPAEAAGLARGDLVVAAAGRPVTDIDALQSALAAAGDEPLALTVVRGTDELELSAALAGAAR